MEIEKAALQDAVLGQDFLTWLWFKSEKNGWLFKLKDGEEINVFLEQKVSVRGGEGENAETATVSGPHSEFNEARQGLRTGKRVDKALLRFERDGNTWFVGIKAQDLSLNALRTPKVETRLEEGDDPDAPLLEKLFLVEQCSNFIDELYEQFLTLRLSVSWVDELRDFAEWLEAVEK